jgi:hypothetical protein
MTTAVPITGKVGGESGGFAHKVAREGKSPPRAPLLTRRGLSLAETGLESCNLPRSRTGPELPPTPPTQFGQLWSMTAPTGAYFRPSDAFISATVVSLSGLRL